MNILIVSQYFWPEEFRINDLAQGLQKRGHSVTVLTGMPNYPKGNFFSGYGFFGPRTERYNNITIHRVPLITRGQRQTWRLILNYISFTFFACLLGPWYCRGKFDLIFVAQYSPVTVAIPAILLKKIKKASLFMWVQDLWPESLSATGAIKSQFLLNLVNQLVRYIYRHCDRILVQSEGFIDYISSVGVPVKKIAYFPNWAEDIYQNTSLQIKADKSKLPRGFIVMFAGNIGAAQDFGNILSAFEKIKDRLDIHLVVLGDGRMRGWVEEEIVKRGLSPTCHLLGRFPTEAMPGFFAQAQVMLVTLKNEPIFSLTIPGKVQSYLACARPIVAALAGEGEKIIRLANCGVAVKPEDSTALAEAIVKMCSISPSAREQLGRNGWQYYQNNFSRELLLNNFEGFL